MSEKVKLSDLLLSVKVFLGAVLGKQFTHFVMQC